MKSQRSPRRAPGGPGIEPRWTHGAKVAVRQVLEPQASQHRIKLRIRHSLAFEHQYASGLIISDADGNERGGYVTSDQFGEANPKGGVNLDIHDSKGNEAQLTVFPDGPKLKMKKMKATVAELPSTSR